MEIVLLKSRPDIAALVKLVSKKHKAFIATPRPEVTLRGTYWDGGSRSEYYKVHLASKHLQKLPSVSPPQFGGPREEPVHKLEPGYAVIEAGTFCGKPATPTIHFHPDDKM